MRALNDNEMKIMRNLGTALTLLEEAKTLAMVERNNTENRKADNYRVMPNDIQTAISAIKIAQRNQI